MDDYERLRQILHKHPTGAPPSEAFQEILRTLFTPQEAHVALGMGFAPRTAQKIAAVAAVVEDEARIACESMANKGVIFARRKDGQMAYALLPTIPGIFEFPFMRGGGTPVHDRLARLWEQYHREALGNEFAGSPTPFARIVPVEQSVHSEVQVLPYEELSVLLDGVQTFALAQCACRVSVAACDRPRDVCLIFDRTAEFLIERGLADRISRAQADEVVRRSEQAGLVHTTSNNQAGVTFLCNCCPCCCTVLRGLTQLENPNAFARSRWRAEVDAELCVGCGTCEQERCPVAAVRVADGVATVDAERCIGCGLCASACEQQAVHMLPRPQSAPEPPETAAEAGMCIAAEKGRLEEFLPLLERQLRRFSPSGRRGCEASRRRVGEAAKRLAIG